MQFSESFRETDWFFIAQGTKDEDYMSKLQNVEFDVISIFSFHLFSLFTTIKNIMSKIILHNGNCFCQTIWRISNCYWTPQMIFCNGTISCLHI